MDLKEKTAAILKQYEVGSRFSYLPVLPKASVLIPLFVRDGEVHMLMTLRSQEVGKGRVECNRDCVICGSEWSISSKLGPAASGGHSCASKADVLGLHQLRTNAGEVCFPGGKRDPRDRDDVDTALREAEEEIGLPPDQVDVVCTLFPIMNKSGLLVTPVVGFIEASFSPRPNPAEVSAVFTVPLEFFTREIDHSSYSATGIAGLLHSFQFPDPKSGSHYQIWGLTAILAILVSVLALRKKPEFETGFDSDDPVSFFQHNLNKRISKL
ncbi:peroxisomal coenzyme A diphosphatase NUDT7 isoform X1 [Oncorhynchus kisutch]|uniref:Nudix hydrolase 7 n=1 Tax=Oncorhynchus kisutch TaxID=8019 RepID=A0A8C7J8U6_ONCKI|nr:peroxisomal coenzyme A diphosphatase NUDT7 isoform X1 [Oncorhynchus kisutch]XP_031656956.1 peroxisomal coenzyme A diphosphatase NUDT7 isoform X1 [Oncorhynchus kisutch]